MLIAETAGSNCSTFCDYIHVMTDPAHIMAEVTITVIFALFEVLFVGLFWKRWLKPRIARTIHAEVDAEHGIEHHDDHIHKNDSAALAEDCLPMIWDDETKVTHHVCDEWPASLCTDESHTPKLPVKAPEKPAEGPMGCLPTARRRPFENPHSLDFEECPF